MKVPQLLIPLTLLAQSAMVSCKNVVDLPAQIESLNKRDSESKSEDTASEDIEPANYPPLGGYGFPILDNREAEADPDSKNVIDLSQGFKDLTKRAAKNIVDLSEGFKDLVKREGKNVFDFTVEFHEKAKREGKNIIHLASDFKNLEKRESKNLLSIELSDDTIVILPKRNLDLQQLLTDADLLSDEQKRTIFKIVTLSHPEIIQEPLTGEHPQTGPTLLTTLLTQHQSISHYSYMIRDNIPLSRQFDDIDSSYIVLAPSDSAIESLSKLPWYYPVVVDQDTMTESETERIKKENVNDFIGKHIIAVKNKKQLVSFDALVCSTVDGLRVKISKNEETSGKYTVTAFNGETGEEDVKYQVGVNAVWRCENGVVLELDGALSLP
ncbi:hypothetical protein WICPIJ_007673 [Wickerhamomyces pijperi]|uniref:FAS1 domain-containing protein n=1 Tax=Wickerhamomyces pijperi TaxID=599730 RepID=A0A9P8TK79_WICPI|nr:hypothetical protein WICPIJ_007673 [Wickerhamomyces pijperi]